MSEGKHEVVVELRNNAAVGFEAEGWNLNDPDGFVQIIIEEQVIFFPHDVILNVRVPNLSTIALNDPEAQEDEEVVEAEVIPLRADE